MKRPSFQFYPADWRNNAKLRRCSWGARGAWIELLGLLHDSDDYGLLRWPLKQIAQALGCPVKLLNELVECGVLYGVEKGACEALVYTPRSGRKNGEPVELVAAQQGPVWFSPRMVRDEYVRTVRGENTRFSEENNPQNPSPKGGLGAGNGDAPTPRQGDGATSSSSSSTSVPNGTSAAADARQRFPMDEHWNPDDVSLGAQLRVAGLSRDAIDTGAVIITGEAARRDNAAKIAELFADETGKFVCATAGPTLETIMAAHGSGCLCVSHGWRFFTSPSRR